MDEPGVTNKNDLNIDNILTKIAPKDSSATHKTEPDEEDVVIIEQPLNRPGTSQL